MTDWPTIAPECVVDGEIRLIDWQAAESVCVVLLCRASLVEPRGEWGEDDQQDR